MRSYDLAELEEMSGLSRRTISDYVSRGLLAGPSHRGRGARYSQKDLDALRVIPRLRTVLKSDFPNLNAIREFLDGLETSDLRRLVRMTNERAFEVEVRRIRVRRRLRTFLPAVPPEHLAMMLGELTPQQVCLVDRGQIHIGSLIDIEQLSAGALPRADVSAPAAQPDQRLHAGAHYPLAHDPLETGGNPAGSQGERWERFGNSTVQVRIEKSAFGRVKEGPSLSQTIKDFAAQIEDLLKTSG